MAELFGRVDGTCGGRGGSMHIFDAERRFMGGYGIVGGNLPLAAGLALSSDYRGDGRGHRLHVRRRRLEHGQLRRDDEPGGALEPARRLPGREQPLRDGHGDRAPLGGQTDLSKKAEGYGVPGVRVDGMDVLAVREASQSTSGWRARTASRPWSRPSPTATAATPRPTPRSTARRKRSRSGSRRTRSRPSPPA